jgi:PAS domain S-box-containing protein
MKDADKTKEQLIEELVELRRRVAELEASEAEHRAEKNRSEAIIAAIGSGISIQDTNFKILYQNQVLKDWVGDHTGEYCYTAYQRKKNVCKRCPVVMSFKDGGIHKAEKTFSTDKGVMHFELTSSPLRDSAGKIIAGIEVIRDVTEYKRAEEALKESENKFRSLAEKSLAGIYLIQDNVFKYVNPRMAEIFGYKVKELINKKGPEDVTLPEDRAIVRQNIQKRLSGKSKSIHYSFRGVKKNGDVVHLEVYGSRIMYQERPAVIGTLLDITERKSLEEQLRHAQKMEVIGTLTGGISHEFNNILTAIIGYGEFLQDAIEEGSPLRAYVDMIQASAKRAAGLTQGLLAYSRKQAVHLRQTDLNEIIRKVERLLLRFISENIELRILLADEVLPVMVDTNQIEQVLMNLVTNAVDAMPDGGDLIISTERREIDSDFVRTRGYGKPGVYAVLSVSDTGTGMDKKTKEKIFEPFFTTKDVGKGTGLGLSMVYGTVKMHNGYIDVQSKPGKGTTFRVYLPIVNTEVKKLRTSSVSPLKKGTETVLLAEDDAEVRRLIKTLLEKSGYTVIEAVDGEDAVRKFMENKDDIQLLLSDIVIPKKDGKKVYDEIAKIKPKIKVLFMSGYTGEVMYEKGIIREGLSFVSKPVSPKELLGRVREILDHI